jgi:hypothetical protein
VLGKSQFLFAVDKEIILIYHFCSDPSEATGVPMVAVPYIPDIEADPEQDPAATESKTVTTVITKTYTVPPPTHPELYKPRTFENTRLGSYVYLVVYDIAGILFHLSLCCIYDPLLSAPARTTCPSCHREITTSVFEGMDCGTITAVVLIVVFFAPLLDSADHARMQRGKACLSYMPCHSRNDA